MANILISFYNGIENFRDGRKIPCFYESMLRGLSQAGNNLLVHMTSRFAGDFPEIPAELKDEIIRFNPDLCIFFNNAFYDCTGFLDCPILVYEVDSALYYSNKNRIKEKPSRYKFALAQDVSLENVRTMLNAEAGSMMKIPFFTEVRAKPTELRQNICFIGTKFFNEGRDTTPYKSFISCNPSYDEKQQYLSLLRDFAADPCIAEDDFWAKYPPPPGKIKDNFNFFALYNCLSEFKRRTVLSSIADLGIGLYGTKSWETDSYNDPELIMNYRPDSVFSLSHNEDIYNSSKIGINIPHIQSREGIAWRTLDIMASNACLVNEFTPGTEDRIGKFIPAYNSPWEAREICLRLLKNENLRADIVAQSNALVEQKYRFKHIMPMLETLTGTKLSAGGDGSMRFIDSEPAQKKKRQPKRTYLLMKWVHDKLERKLRRKSLI